MLLTTLTIFIAASGALVVLNGVNGTHQPADALLHFYEESLQQSQLSDDDDSDGKPSPPGEPPLVH